MLDVFAQFLKPGTQGGVEHYLRNLLLGFRTAAIDIDVWAGRPGSPGGRFGQEQLDILSLTNSSVLLPNYFTPPLRSASTHATTVIHDLLFKSHPATLPTLKKAWLEVTIPLTLARADRVVAISEFSRQELFKHYPRLSSRVDIRVIHNPIDITRFREPDHSVVPAGPYVLCPSSGFEHKNVMFALKLFRDRAELAGLQLVLVGQLPSKMGKSASTDRFKLEYAELISQCPVLELGFVSDEALGALYLHASAVLFPSLYEGFGMPIFEALELGAPVVCTSVGAVPDFPDLPAHVVTTPADPDEWVIAILKAVGQERSSAAAGAWIEALKPAPIAQAYAECCGVE